MTEVRYSEEQYVCACLISFSDVISVLTEIQEFHENTSRGSRVVPRGLTRRTDGRIDMTKPILAFDNSANAPKKK